MHYAARLATEAAVEHLKIDAYRVAQPSTTTSTTTNSQLQLALTPSRDETSAEMQPSVKSNKTSTFPGDRVSLSVKEGAGRRVERGGLKEAMPPRCQFTILPACALSVCQAHPAVRWWFVQQHLLLACPFACLPLAGLVAHVARCTLHVQVSIGLLGGHFVEC